MKAVIKIYIFILIIANLIACTNKTELKVEVYETSVNGSKLKKIESFKTEKSSTIIELFPEKEYQTITGFGGSFTESSASLLYQLSKENQTKILEAYFGETGARYSLTRTHMNSCDFSLSNYSYAEVPDDRELKHFTIEHDKQAIIPMIQAAKKVSKNGFKIISSPWTAPKWMKDNNKYVGGKLLPKYYDTWALFFSKYVGAYKKEGINIWGFTVENEPLGNGNNWESMHYSAGEMTNFVQNYLGPKLEKEKQDVKILGYDQNRDHLKEWVDDMYKDEKSSKYFDGTSIHWYASTYEVFPEALQYAHHKAPNKYLIQTEACVDSEIPKWKDDKWYWSKNATDWGWDWAPEKDKFLHPKYAPVSRYARDIIGCLNNWVDGWIDWNMILDTKGGPNWFKNWCVAPVIVDTKNDEVYFTPLYYTLSHFSRYIFPGAKKIDLNNTDKDLLVTAVKNKDGSLIIVVFNESKTPMNFKLKYNNHYKNISISNQAIQTIIIPYKK